MDKKILYELGVTDGMIDHLERDDLDRPFGYRCQPPYYWQSSPIAERGIVPLWERGVVVCYFNPANRRFEECSLEDIDHPFCSYSSLQGLLAKLFLEGWEDEMSDSELRTQAELFGFRHLDAMLNGVKTAGHDYDTWREQFPVICSNL